MQCITQINFKIIPPFERAFPTTICKSVSKSNAWQNEQCCFLKSMESMSTFKLLRIFHLNSCCIYIEKLEWAVKREREKVFVYAICIHSESVHKLRHFSEVEYETGKTLFILLHFYTLIKIHGKAKYIQCKQEYSIIEI